MSQIEQFKKLEEKKLDENQDYNEIKGLSNEAKQKLNQIKPDSVGQALEFQEYPLQTLM